MSLSAKYFIAKISDTAGRKDLLRLSKILTVMLCGIVCTERSLAADSQQSVVEIGFEYIPAWSDETYIYLARLPDGKIHCSVQTRAGIGEDASKRKWKTVNEVVVSPEDFSRLESGFDTPALRHAAERDWPPFPDGSGWILRKKIGSWSVEIRASNPDMSIDGLPIVKLARAFATIAHTPILPEEAPDPLGGIPTVVPVEPFPKVPGSKGGNP